MTEGLAAAAIMAAASIFAVVWQSRKTRRVNTKEHHETGAMLRRHSKQLKKIARTLDAHLEDHKKETP